VYLAVAVVTATLMLILQYPVVAATSVCAVFAVMLVVAEDN
jgi:hypothetical protein